MPIGLRRGNVDGWLGMHGDRPAKAQ